MDNISSAQLMQGIYEELKNKIGTDWRELPRPAQSFEKPSVYSRPGFREKIIYHHADIFSRDYKNFALLLGMNHDESPYYQNNYEKDISLLEFSDLWNIVNTLDNADPRAYSIVHSTTNGRILAKVGGPIKGFQQFPFNELDNMYVQKKDVTPTYENGQTTTVLSYHPDSIKRITDFILDSGVMPFKSAKEIMFMG